MTDDHAAAPAMPADATGDAPTTPMPGAVGDTTGKTWLLWVDFETTGLDTHRDEIIEAAFILTDTDLTEVGRWEKIFQPSTLAMERLLDNKIVREMHVAPIVSEDDGVYLAGSGVAAFDRRFIDRDLPGVAGLLHYAPIDVGVLKRCWRMWTGQDISDDNNRKTHRAMSDAEGHLNEARLFRAAFRAAFKGLAS